MGLSFTSTETNVFSGKATELFIFSSLMLHISGSLQGKGSSSSENFPNMV